MDNAQKVTSIRLSGSEDSQSPLWLAGLSRDSELFGALGRSRAYALDPERRGGSEAPPLLTVEIPHDALVEVEFDDGLRFWTTGEDLRDRLTPPEARQARGRQARGREDDGGPWTLPAALALPDGKRGIGGRLVLKALRWVGFDAQRMGRDLIVEQAERRAVATEGLYRMGEDGITGTPLDAPIADGGPVLILLHGTASSTRGSFSKLWLRQPEQWARLRAHYGQRIYALEHWTLTRSPVDNALALARLLPTRGEVSFLSHSRGGLVGELLCLDPFEARLPPAEAGQAAEADPADSAERAARQRQRQALDTLLAELRRRPELVIGRFARVACPILGTTLAGDKLDKWGSLLVLAAIADEMRRSSKRALGGLGLSGELIRLGLDTLGETLAGILASRRKASELPGLAAMMPGSDLVALLNTQPGRGELFVVAGDAAAQEGDWLAGLRFWLTDRYYEQDHDLVVDTRAMLDGAPRSADPAARRARVLFRSGSEVNHFNYFGNPDSARAVAAALTGPTEADPPFRDYFGVWPLPERTGEASRGLFGPRPRVDPPLAEARGIVVLIPGLCGSELMAGTRALWASLLALAGGAFRDDLSIDKPRILPGPPLADTYLPLANALRKRGYVVVMHGYDWRKALADSVPALQQALRTALDAAAKIGKPVHAIAHSMGGVLIRSAFAGDPALWAQWRGQPGAPRVLMLGTPNKGSHAVTLLLTGRDKFFRQLALLDFGHSQNDLLKTAVRFPGVLELLPVDPAENGDEIRLPATWSGFQAGDGQAGWPLPDPATLAQSRAVWDALAAHDPLLGDERLLYVAGIAPQTPVQARVDNGRFELLATPRGDGRVPWASGIPAACRDGQRVYYVNALHGDLPKAGDAFDGYVELLERGRSEQLASRPPTAARGGDAELQPYDPVEAEAALFPTRGDLLAAATGGSLRPGGRRPDESPQARVRVLHGDLLYAHFPVLVGHLSGANTLEYAEHLLDKALGGQLQKRLEAGLHAGPLGSYATFRRGPQDSFIAGALVIGIGRIGELSAGQLSLAVSRAVSAYAIEELEWRRQRDGAGFTPPLSLGISALLIGAGVGQLSLQDSVAAILRGHRDARGRLRSAQLDGLIQLDALDFIEILEDRAIQALRAAQDAVEFDSSLRRRFYVAPALESREGARRRAWAAAEEGLWQQLAISVVGETENAPRLLFSAHGELARAEQMLNSVPLRDFERFTQSLISTEQDQEQVGRSLFEMLVPNWLKDQAPDRRRALLIVDKRSAAFPWELLRDRASEYDGDADKPLSVRSGLIRQLSTTSFRNNVQRPTKPTAMVVGDPLLGDWAGVLHPLDGAAKEARQIAGQLQDAGFETVARIRANASQILVDLFRDEWRILHLSGHGVYLEDLPATARIAARPRATGMVIGEGDLLTTAHIAQMRVVPDFVFINCCSLGRIEGDPLLPDGARPGDPRLAANLATELIESGVRGVIAAGWKVLDDAALLFAQTFYERFLAGTPFGEAVLAAREATFAQHGASNTWGAYQCYGNPGFVLPCSTREDGKSRGPVDYRFVSPSEALCELERLTLDASAARQLAPQPRPDILSHAAPLLALCEKQGWIAHGRLLEAFGNLMAEYGEHAAAIAHYRHALAAPDGSASRRAEEQLANMLTRLALQKNSGGQRKEALALLDEAEAILAPGPYRHFASPERISLLGAVLKRRLACLVDGEHRPRADVLKTLKTLQHTYAEAERLALAAGSPHIYPGLNALQAGALRHVAGALEADELAPLNASLAAIGAELGPAFAPKDFWDRMARPDLALTEWLFALATPPADGNPPPLPQEAYVTLLEQEASPRARESVISTLHILQAAASSLAGRNDGPARRAAEALQGLLDAIGP